MTKRMSLAPFSLRRFTAADTELPVASIGSTTMVRRSADVIRHFQGIFDRLQRFVDCDRAQYGQRERKESVQHAFQQAIAGTEHGNDDEFLAFQNRRFHFGQRGFDICVVIGRSRQTS